MGGLGLFLFSLFLKGGIKGGICFLLIKVVAVFFLRFFSYVDVVPTLIGPRERGRPRQAGSAAGDDALWGPRRGPRSANKRSVESPLSPSSARREWAGGGRRGTWDNFSLKLVNARVIKDSAISSAAYVNVAQNDGYVPRKGLGPWRLVLGRVRLVV